MRVLKTFQPGERGARRLTDRFGTSLVCVRHRLDPLTDTRITTVELVVDTTPVKRRGLADCSTNEPRRAPLVAVKVAYGEVALRERIKQAGGRWRPEARAWELPLDVVRRLGLADRVAAQVQPRVAVAGRFKHGNA